MWFRYEILLGHLHGLCPAVSWGAGLPMFPSSNLAKTCCWCSPGAISAASFQSQRRSQLKKNERSMFVSTPALDNTAATTCQ